MSRRPVAVAFRDGAPAPVEKFSGSEPAGCSFWRLAAEGRGFSTVPADHYNCPVGSYTHNIPLPETRAHELPSVLGTMTSLGYLKMEEVPGIPVVPGRRKRLCTRRSANAEVDPDVVLFVATPGRLMLLEEAASEPASRPNCRYWRGPLAWRFPLQWLHGMVTSAGCIGNRVYTNIGDEGDCTPLSRGMLWSWWRKSWRPSRGPMPLWSSIIAGGRASYRRRNLPLADARGSERARGSEGNAAQKADAGSTVESKYRCESRSAVHCSWQSACRRESRCMRGMRWW